MFAFSCIKSCLCISYFN